MSHNASHIIISRATGGTASIVQSSKVELSFPTGMPLAERMKIIRRTEMLLDKIEHDNTAEDAPSGE